MTPRQILVDLMVLECVTKQKEETPPMQAFSMPESSSNLSKKSIRGSPMPTSGLWLA
jgi:hypothetical protein